MADKDQFEALTKEHTQIYHGFTKFMTWGTALCIVTLILLAIFVV